MSASDHQSSNDRHAIAATAAAWLSRRDRGFTSAEQDRFLQWLQADPRHRAEVARIERSWRALDSLAAWQPADGAAPNPDLLAPAPPPRRRFFPLAPARDRDTAAGRVKVAGTFQADKPAAFARLLEAGFGIAVERRAGGAWVLQSAPAPAAKK